MKWYQKLQPATQKVRLATLVADKELKKLNRAFLIAKADLEMAIARGLSPAVIERKTVKRLRYEAAMLEAKASAIESNGEWQTAIAKEG